MLKCSIFREERKSVGVEKTFKSMSSENELLPKIEKLTQELEKDLHRLKFSGRTISLKYKLDTFENYTKSITIKNYVNNFNDLFPIVKSLLLSVMPVTVRLLGIRVSNLQYLGKTNKTDITKVSHFLKKIPCFLM